MRPPITGEVPYYTERAGRHPAQGMDLKRLAGALAEHRRTAALLALVTTFAGVALLLDRRKGSGVECLGRLLRGVGGGSFLSPVWPPPASPTQVRKTVASRFLGIVTLQGRLLPIFPAIGLGLILADLGYNVLLSATPALQTEDIIVLLAAAMLLLYGLIPERFASERDFAFIFFIALNGILVVPLLLARAYYADFERSVDLYSWIALAPQTGGLLNILGVANSVHPVSGSAAPGLTFRPQHLSVEVTVVITTACSGIYSFGIFASAFIAFVSTESETLTRKTWAFLAIGLLAAYAANVLRMVVIVLVGYYTDTPASDLQNMLVAHSYLGWLIFLGWVTLFWGILLRWMPRSTSALPALKEKSRNVRSLCSICGASLSPVAPASQCRCGVFYHKACFASEGQCRACGRGTLS